MKNIILIGTIVAAFCIGAFQLKAAAPVVEFRSLSKDAVLQRGDIETATKSKAKDGTRVRISLNKNGTKSLQDFALKHPGEPLVIVLKDKVLSAPAMKGPIAGNSFEISGLAETDVDQLIDAFHP